MTDAARKLAATWSISLDTECPKCGEEFDMLCTTDFWEDHQGLQLCENSMDRAEDVDATCPKCGHEFKVDLEY
jgi:predicted RNA-binding Zn-ribbon protein involved in translation (DUF1610 family)